MSDARLRPDEAASDTVDLINFSFYSAEEVRKISVKAITRAELLDSKQSPVPDGLYDPALGPVNELDTCKTCGQQVAHCTGHYGHIELARPVYNPLLFHTLKKILQIACVYCHKFRMGPIKVSKYVSILNLIGEGNIIAAKKLATNFLHEAIFGPGEANSQVNSHPGANCLDGGWTSIQQSEAASVLLEIMREQPKKCNYCDRSCPKIGSLTFGWLEMSLHNSRVRANFIEDSSFEFSSKGGMERNIGSNEKWMDNNEVLQSKSSGSASEGDGELLEPEKNTKGTELERGLPPEYLKQIASCENVDLPPSKAEGILKNLWKRESELCMLICDIQCRSRNLRNVEREKGHTMFFLKALLVPPNKFRPVACGMKELLEHPQNILYTRVVTSNILLNAEVNDQDIMRKWRSLQYNVNVLFDNSKAFGKNDENLSGFRQLLDKKEGLFRQKMMGKRVNFACRSVISPDPYLAVNEIGIPPYFALRLTYPERVTPWNVNKLRQAVVNGSDCYPGATHYMEREKFYTLQAGMNMRSAIARKLPISGAFAKMGIEPETKFEGKFVYRHLQDGDVVLVNRQPTLHKPGMMAHIVRVMNGEKTIRMHYANCSTYNADFDGDEMNVHVPQDEISRAESVHIVNANKQYIVSTSGAPIRSLIQDHIVSAVLLTKRDTFLTREEYHQLLYASCVPPSSYNYQAAKFGQKISVLADVEEIQCFSPAILKPKQLWTGKQVITAILHHITKGRLPLSVSKEGKVPREYFGKDATERSLFVYNNELVHGIIDKAQFGKCGLVHTVHELYGAETAGQLLAVFSRLFTLFLQMHGFTCGVDDLLLLQKSDVKRKRILESSEERSEDVHSRFTASATDSLEDSLKLLKETEKVVRRNAETATIRLDRMMSNALNALTSEVNKVLFPRGLQKSFPKNCLSLMTSTGAKGGLVNMTQISSLLGQQELEGKRVPRMASGKTLPCFPAWDISSRAGGFISDRFLTGLRPQEYYFHCMAGREGLVDTAVKTSRSGYLQRCLVKNLECLKVCYDHTVRDADGSVIQFTYGEDGVDVQKSSFLGEFEILAMNHKVLEKMSNQLEYDNLSKSNSYLKELPSELNEKAVQYLRQLSKSSNGYVNNNKLKRKDLLKLVKFKYLSSLAEPGEAVGVLAGQSIGEPSTQMTLNTFHLAGRGEMNVTLGIPRLVEILMHAKAEILTPIMTCPLHDWRTRDDAEFVAAKLGRISLADVIETMNVSIAPFSAIGKQAWTVYKLTLKVYSPELFPPHSGITLELCMDTIQSKFVKMIAEDVHKHMNFLSTINGIQMRSARLDDGADDQSGTMNNKDNADGKEDDIDDHKDEDKHDDDDDDDDVKAEDDLGADAEKGKRQVNDEIEYEDDCDVENEESGLDDEHEHGGAQSESEIENEFIKGEEDGEIEGQDLLLEEAAVEPTPSKVAVGKKEAKPKAEGKKARKKLGKGSERIVMAEPKGQEFHVHFKFYQDEPHILLAGIAQRAAKRVYVKACKNIDRVTVVEPKRRGDPLVLQTAGVNFSVLWGLNEYVDIDRMTTNNIQAMLAVYGVEAARATILNEVKAVFGAYGIQVNIRHLMLIADLMTCNGDYRPLNRTGMRKFSTSPFCRMSFEMATTTIAESAMHGFADNLESPSACISLGKIVKMGTGGFDLLHNFKL